jgi:hypothetical protein
LPTATASEARRHKKLANLAKPQQNAEALLNRLSTEKGSTDWTELLGLSDSRFIDCLAPSRPPGCRRSAWPVQRRCWQPSSHEKRRPCFHGRRGEENGASIPGVDGKEGYEASQFARFNVVSFGGCQFFADGQFFFENGMRYHCSQIHSKRVREFAQLGLVAPAHADLKKCPFPFRAFSHNPTAINFLDWEFPEQRGLAKLLEEGKPFSFAVCPVAENMRLKLVPMQQGGGDEQVQRVAGCLIFGSFK